MIIADRFKRIIKSPCRFRDILELNTSFSVVYKFFSLNLQIDVKVKIGHSLYKSYRAIIDLFFVVDLEFYVAYFNIILNFLSCILVKLHITLKEPEKSVEDRINETRP